MFYILYGRYPINSMTLDTPATFVGMTCTAEALRVSSIETCGHLAGRLDATKRLGFLPELYSNYYR